jgi:hypothetical protein
MGEKLKIPFFICVGDHAWAKAGGISGAGKVGY